jgi:hypothetical protein
MLLLLQQSILKPVELLLRGAVRSLALDLHRAGLVRLQLVRDISLLGGLGRLGRAPFQDVALGVAGLDRRRLVRLELLEVEVLDEVRCAGKRVMLAGSARRPRDCMEEGQRAQESHAPGWEGRADEP